MAEDATFGGDKSPSTTTDTLVKGDNKIPAMSMGETGFNGLTVVGGNILEEHQYELRWPYLIHTLKDMSKDATIAPALSLVESQISRIGWRVKIPKGHEGELDSKAEFLRECMTDMDHSWNDFINQAVSFVRYGFSIHEVVLRYRNKKYGSRFDDGLVGIRKLPIRSQDSIIAPEYKNKGRDLVGFWQKVNIPTNAGGAGSYEALNESKVLLKKEHILHFKTGSIKDNPFGLSPLVACWKDWKYRTSLQEHEMIGISQDLRGLKVIYIHPKYLDPNASPEDKAVAEYYRNIVRTLHNGEQSGILLPAISDESGNPVFKFEVVSVLGQKAHNVDEVIERYNRSILTALTADFLILGQSGGGSFALGQTKFTISEIAIQSKLREIQDVLNHHLIPLIFKMNGWDTETTPYFEHDPIQQKDIDVFSSAVQRTAAVGLLPKTPKVVNHICEELGLPIEFDEAMDREQFLSLLTQFESRSGDGLETPFEGTSTGGADAGDASVSNKEN